MTILLIITIVMPREMPDIRQRFPEPTIEQCWRDAAEFVARGTPKAAEGAVGVMAGCYSPAVPEDDS